jgi:hypothetical protein
VINPPWFQDPIEQTAFNAFAYHQQNIEDFIDALVASDDPNDYSNQYAAARSANLDVNSLTTQEREYIEREVTKRNAL